MLILIIITICKFILFFIPLLISIAFLTLLERKVIGSIQQRKGPNVVGLMGVLQPISDGFKLILKETIIPAHATTFLFLAAPFLMFLCAIIIWFVVVYNIQGSFYITDLSILYIFVISSLSVYGTIFAAWASNSKYSLLGGLRAAAQMISYEISIGIIIINVAMLSTSFNLLDIVEMQYNNWYIMSLLPLFFLFFISALVETSRTPFDLPEAEGELVAGYNVEYSALVFALFFLAEYSNIIFMSVLSVLLFFGGWLNLFYLDDSDDAMFLVVVNFSFNNFFILSFKTLIIICLFIWVRATYPRYRYDQLMFLGWKVFLPLSIGFLLLNSILVRIFF